MAVAKGWTELEYTLSGNPKGTTVFFVHGWPDTPESAFGAMIPACAALGYRICAVVLPGYGKREVPFFGFKNSVIVALLRATIEKVMRDAPVRRCAVVAHDWGSYFSHFCIRANPGIVDAFVGLDVSADVSLPQLVFFFFYYQIWLVLSFFLPPILGNPLARWVAGGSVIRLFAPRPELATRQRSYMYLQTTAWVFSFGFSDRAFPRFGSRPRLPDGLPVLFMHSSATLFQFHTPRYDALVRGTSPKSAVVEVDDPDHWFPVRGKHTATTIARITAFLQENAPAK